MPVVKPAPSNAPRLRRRPGLVGAPNPALAPILVHASASASAPHPSLVRSRAAALARALALTLALALAPSPASPPVPGAAAQTPPEGYRLVDTWTSRQPELTLPEFKEPTGLDVAGDDTIFVADRQDGILYRIRADAVVEGGWPTNSAIGRPRDVAVLGDRVYVLGDQGGEIRTLDGTPLGTWSGESGQGIAAGPERRIYVSRLEVGTGQVGAVIDVRDVDGGRLETWRPRLPIRSAAGLAVGGDGKVYLAADGAVYVFQAGEVTGLLRVASSVEGPDVRDVAVDPQGRAFAIQENLLAAWDTATSRYIGHAPRPSSAWLAAGPGVGLVFATQDNSGFTGLSYLPDRSSLDGGVVRWGDVDESLGQLQGPRRLASGSGSVFILDALLQAERIQHWSAAGRPIEQWESAAVTDVVGGAAQPCYLHGASIRCLGPARTALWEHTPAAGGWLTVADGNVGVIAAVDLAEQRVWLVDRTGNPIGDWPLGADGGYSAITDVAVADGRLYLADRGAHRVEVRAFDGQLLSTLDVRADALRLASADGFLYALARDGWIWKYDAGGAVRAAWRPVPDGVPADIAAGPGGRVYVADPAAKDDQADADQILVFEPGGVPSPLPPPLPKDRCGIGLDKRAAPAVVYPGEPVTVRLLVSGRCPPNNGRLDVALILDRSGSMMERALTAAQSAAITFVNELDPTGAQVAVVAFSDTAAVLQPLSGNLQQAVRAVASLDAGGQTKYVAALDLAREELSGPASRPDVPRIAVMLTDGRPTDAPLIMDAARRLKAAGVVLYTIGLGKQPNEDMLREMASQPDLFYRAPDESELAGIYTEIARRISSAHLLSTATITDDLPDDMDLVPGSPVPPAEVQGRRLIWQLADVSAAGLGLRYEVRPRRSGHRPTNVLAVLNFVDAMGDAGALTFPIPTIDVLPRTRWEAYLPLVWKNVCRPQRADVVLVFDISSSMLGEAGPGSPRSKLEAALKAGRTFLDAMELPGDQAAIVAFDEQATLVQPLTGSRAALEAALAGIEAGEGTRIDLGLQVAAVEILSRRHIATNNPVIIILTDGRPTPGTEEQALAEARVARAFNITIFAIGLGQDTDLSLLIRVTSNASQVEFAPVASDLGAIYARIAGRVLCE